MQLLTLSVQQERYVEMQHCRMWAAASSRHIHYKHISWHEAQQQCKASKQAYGVSIEAEEVWYEGMHAVGRHKVL